MNTPNCPNSELVRFLDAQSRDYATAIAELRAGRKRSHWIWFVLPQLRGLGSSQFADFYGIASLEEAKAYLSHPILGARLRDCVVAIGTHAGTGIDVILGEIDAMKYRSCLTLFKQVDSADPVFAEALRGFFQGIEDERTLDMLATAKRHLHAP
jgi:uncharacterized protein (DUF1810 family)